MQITAETNKFLHHKLPIEDEEKILGVYRHHWFAYASIWLIGLVMVVVVMALGVLLTSFGGSDSALAGRQTQVLAAAGCLAVLLVVGTFVPVYLRMQEQVVLTEESLLQILQPSVFASKINQVSLQHITDVSVHQDFFGTMFGYGHITIETPGEQDNYEFTVLANPHEASREIIHAHENFNAALEGGHMPTTLGSGRLPQAPTIDPQQYQQFLAYQQMLAQQQQDQAAGGSPQTARADDPTAQDQRGPQNPPSKNA